MRSITATDQGGFRTQKMSSTSSHLSPPADRRLLSAFLEHFGLPCETQADGLLRRLARRFAELPYENLTKIIRDAQCADVIQARRSPSDVVADFIALGTGGTCFSLTATLLHLVRSLGWRAEPILADRSYGQDTHCALLVWIDNRPHLLDPGYLIVDPIPMEMTGERTITTAFNQLTLAPREQSEKIDLFTSQQGNSTYRLTFKTQPVDAREFLRAWDASFDWDMMRYPLLTRTCGNRQLYLRGSRFQVRSHDLLDRQDIPPDEMIPRIAAQFGIDASVTARALTVLRQKGEL